MDADSLKFIESNGLAFAYEAGSYTVANPASVGLIPPGRIRGAGASLAEALKGYMVVLVQERGEQKMPLAEYVKEATADPVVVEAVARDAKMPEPKPVEELPVDDAKPVEGLSMKGS